MSVALEGRLLMLVAELRRSVSDVMASDRPNPP
jgi:hypothetical protein